MDTILDQLDLMAVEVDTANREKVLGAIRSIQLQLETPHNTLSRLSSLHLEITTIRVGVDLGIFRILADNDNPLTISPLSEKTDAAPPVLGRILRHLASAGAIRETALDTFAANSITKTLSQPGYEGAIRHWFDNVGPCFQAWPDFLKEIKYEDVSNASNCAFQKAFDTDETAFEWLSKYPERFGPLQQAMTVQSVADDWFDVFPLEKMLSEFTGACAFIDVAGGFGQQCQTLLRRFPDLLHGRIILQDLKETVNNIPPDFSGFEKMAHDIFMPQPVKGARFYYMRAILHDWPDDKCVEILRHLTASFGQDSQILINEMVLPSTGVPWEATSIDLAMMACSGARERTISEWHALLDAAGLKILRVDTYAARCQNSIIQAALK
ncbi:S-adenosyl-L-methionine-dependent methyltransferase [Nemania sp. FL0916]|nr:S-adenosyl-L-methionine-dependent methyltransferase [Nemania sp. FL0916]